MSNTTLPAAVGARLEPGVGRPVPERANACQHCGSVACVKGGGEMNGYWVIHPGCEAKKAQNGSDDE